MIVPHSSPYSPIPHPLLRTRARSPNTYRIDCDSTALTGTLTAKLAEAILATLRVQREAEVHKLEFRV